MEMLQIAIVEDSLEAADQLESMLHRYRNEYKLPMRIHRYRDPLLFLSQFQKQFDIVFMDILMPRMNGIDAAKELRKADADVMLVFVTSMQQYAIACYEYNAADYIVKPIVYEHFRLKMSRFLPVLYERNPKLGSTILIRTESGLVQLPSSSVCYVEVQGHVCCFHTRTKDYTQKLSIQKAEQMLEGRGFARCNSHLLVNLAYVTGIHGYEASLGDTVLKISQSKKKDFSQKYAEFIGSVQYV